MVPPARSCSRARSEAGRRRRPFRAIALGVVLAASAVGLFPEVPPAEAGVPFDYGGVIGFGNASDFGSPSGTTVNAPIVAMAATATGKGYWLTAADGGIFSYGDAAFLGSAGALALTAPVVAIAATPGGQGYWQLALDGGVFSYGEATFFGSTGAMRLNKPIVGMAPTPSGHGYWLVALDGGVFAFGDARFYGSTGDVSLNSAIVGMAATSTGKGYWMVAADGGIFGFGDARFFGSTGGQELSASIVGMAAGPDDHGYLMAGLDGAVYPFGSAKHYGSNEAVVPTPPIVGIQATPDGKGYWLLDNAAFPTSFSHPSPGGGTADSIVAITAAEIGANPYSDPYCNPYGPCLEWCALFATAVWREAGIPIPAYPFTGNVWGWAEARDMALPASARPTPGDFVFYGTGPNNEFTSVHMGVVVQVWPDGAIVTVEGNSGPGPDGHHNVVINGPYLPEFSEEYNGFGIYAFATP